VTDDDNNSVTVGVIRDLIKRVTDYEVRSQEDRAAFKATIEASLVQLRKDFHVALGPLQLDNIDHRRRHEADQLERVTRQAANDMAHASSQAASDRDSERVQRTLRVQTILITGTLLLLFVGAIVALVIVRYGRI
jgi:hypothetical protein